MSDPQLVWRVNRKPRFPFLSMGEYMALDDGPRETMRRNMKYERIAPTLIYMKLQRGIARYLTSPTRDRRILDNCRAELEADREKAKTPKAIENAKYALRALGVFEGSLNALPIGGLSLIYPPVYQPLIVEGVKISVQPTALVTVNRKRGAPLRGAIAVDAAKGTEPKTDKAKASATEAMIHGAYLLHENVVARVISGDEKPSTEHCLVFHTHRPELVVCPDNYKKMLRNLQAACRDISVSWDKIPPPPAFDPEKARYRD
jgi:hypothetical protein